MFGRLLRETVLSIACQMGNQDALNEASHIFDQWIDGSLRYHKSSGLFVVNFPYSWTISITKVRNLQVNYGVFSSFMCVTSRDCMIFIADVSNSQNIFAFNSTVLQYDHMVAVFYESKESNKTEQQIFSTVAVSELRYFVSGNLILEFLYLLTCSSVAVNLRLLVYRYGMKNSGNETKWNIMFQRYKNTSLAQEKDKLLYGLASVENVALLYK